MRKPTKCQICDNDNIVVISMVSQGKDLVKISCPRCGEYEICDTCLMAVGVLEKIKKNMYALSGLSRLMTENGEHMIILSDAIDKLIANEKIPNQRDIAAKENILLDNLNKITKFYGEIINLHLINDGSIGFAENDEEFYTMLMDLEREDLVDIIEGSRTLDYGIQVKLTKKGLS